MSYRAVAAGGGRRKRRVEVGLQQDVHVYVYHGYVGRRSVSNSAREKARICTSASAWVHTAVPTTAGAAALTAVVMGVGMGVDSNRPAYSRYRSQTTVQRSAVHAALVMSRASEIGAYRQPAVQDRRVIQSVYMRATCMQMGGLVWAYPEQPARPDGSCGRIMSHCACFGCVPSGGGWDGMG